MKQILIDEFRGMDALHNPKKLDQNTMSYIENAHNREGSLNAIKGEDNTLVGVLKVPSIAPGYTLDKTEFDGAKLTYSPLPRITTACTFLTKVTLDADIIAHRDLITVFSPLINQVDTLTMITKVVMYFDAAGVPGASIPMDTFGNGLGVKENTVGATVEKIGTLKPHYGVCKNNLSASDDIWFGLEITSSGTVDDIHFGVSPYSSSTVYHDPVTPGTFVNGGTSLITLVPVFATGSSYQREDEYLLKQLQLNAPITQFTGQHDWSAASAYATNIQYRNISDVIGLTHSTGGGAPYSFVSAGILPAFTPLIHKDGTPGNDSVSFVAGVDAYSTGSWAGSRISTFTRPAIDPSADTTFYTDDKVILGVGTDGIIFITYPGAPHCIPIGFSPFAYNPGRVAAPASEPPSSTRSFEAVVFGDWLVITSPHSLQNAKPFYIRLLYKAPTNGIPITGPANFTMTSLTVPDLPKNVSIQTETLTFWGSEGDRGSIFYSVRGEVDSFTGYTAISQGSPIIEVQKFKDDTIIFFANEIHRFSGTPTSAFSYQKIADFGISHKGMSCSTGDELYFYSWEKGFVSYNGAFKQYEDVLDIGRSVSGLEHGRDDADWMVYNYADDEVVFGFAGESTQPTLSYSFDARTKLFSNRSLKPVCITNASYFRNNITMYSDATSYFNIYRLHDVVGGSDLGGFAAMAVKTGLLSIGGTSEEVMFQDLHLNIEGVTADPPLFGSGAMNVVAEFFNINATKVNTITYTGVDYRTNDRTLQLRLDYKARYVQITISTVLGDGHVRLNDIRITAQDGGKRS